MQPDAADQSMNRPAPETDGEDLLLRLTREHRDAAGLLLALQQHRTASGVGDPAATARELVDDLRRHALDERTHLLPLVRRHVPEGDTTADRIDAELQDLEGRLQQIEQLPVEDDDARLGGLDALLAQHADHLDGHVFPALARACPAEDLRDAGRRASRTAAPGAGLVDRVRDLFRG